LRCNNYEVVDLGVMVSCPAILQAANDEGADIVGLSGLITPSLDEMVHVASEMQRLGLQLPLLIGGATTSRKHTAVKIAPKYEGPVVHVLDASRASGVVTALLSGGDMRQAFLAENQAALEEDRRRFAQRREVPLVPLAEARRRRPALAFREGVEVQPPAWLGTRVVDLPLDALVPYIDWTPFFATWELAGQYPAIFDDAVVGAAAREVFGNAQDLLKTMVAERWLEARAAIGFFPANSEGDDLILWADEHRVARAATLPMLRQQKERPGADPTYTSLADFVAPVGQRDWVGAFAVTAGIGAKERAAALEKAHDDYHAIMVKALADRLAEAAAEYLHREARRAWYAPDEALALPALIKEQYRGIRPAPGYPACPDHTTKRALFAVLGAERAGVTLTEHLAMDPAASVSGLWIGHPESHYFTVGPLGLDQVKDYAHRANVTLHEAERWLQPVLAYEPS
ncbi:MAG: cobalamin-dependent protein, partial [Deltaproteobacteria bacterium]|nr:cobalamin-dependent protein [Deltaproteobacteria bacterium]